VSSHLQKTEKLPAEQPGTHAAPDTNGGGSTGHDDDDDDDAENDAVDGGGQVPSHW
jgi:hypothetical protein